MFLLQSSSNAEILKKQNNAIKICFSSVQRSMRSRLSKRIGLMAKKSVYNRAGLVDFVIMLVNSVVNLPDEFLVGYYILPTACSNGKL